MVAETLPSGSRVGHQLDTTRPRRPTVFGQLWTMLRRNLLVKQRSPKMTLAEIVIPALVLAQFIVTSALGPTGTASNEWKHPNPIHEFIDQPIGYPATGALPLFANTGHNRSDYARVYLVGCTPDSPTTRRIMEDASIIWSAMQVAVPLPRATSLSTKFYATDVDMEEAYLDRSTINIGIGVVFADENVPTLRYTLRFPGGSQGFSALPNAEQPYVTNNYQACRPFNDTESLAPGINCDAHRYMSTGFNAMQNVLTAAYAKFRYNISDGGINLATKLMPLSAAKADYLGVYSFTSTMPAFMVLSLISILIIFLVTVLVTEKEKKHIASMEIMGLRPAVYFISWAIIYFTMVLIFSLAIVTVGKLLNVWSNSDFVLLLLNCLIFGVNATAIGFCVASFFRRPLVAGLVGFGIIVLFGLLSLVEVLVDGVTDTGRWSLALLGPGAFFMSMARVSDAEARGHGIGWGNAMDPMTVYSSTFSFGSAVIMAVLDSFLYIVLAVYLEKVFPSDDKPRERPWFFLLPSYWIRSRKGYTTVSDNQDNKEHQSADIERVPNEMRSRTAISTHGLRKVFPGAKGEAVAVNGFTCEMYEDEILAILGHNGAGKTTLINMLTGMLAPTSGNAFIYGHDVTLSEELEVARTLIGICPQHDVLFDTFTVREHIEFYARLKGFSNSQAKDEFERIIDQIGMRTHSDVHAQKLSGGQKRRLSIAIAVVGNPKILILDEPTSGVDPYNRHFLWDMIRNLRKGRCVIITTQSMQEADVFADRKLIISHGKLRCAGTSLFLKNRFGLGYHLTMSVDRDFPEIEVENFVASRLPGSYKARAHAGEISFVLPKATASQFPALFNELDGNLSNLKIKTYGVSLTTMEEIFLKLADEESDGSVNDLASIETENTTDLKSKTQNFAQLAGTIFARPVKGAVSSWTKFAALCKIRFLLLFRTKIFLAFGIVAPLGLVLMSGVLTLLVTNAATVSTDRLASADIPTLNINELTSDFQAAKADFVYANKIDDFDATGLVEKLKELSGSFSDAEYTNLLSATPHYLGYLFHNKTRADDTIDSATIYYNGSATHSLPYATNLLLNSVFQLRTKSQEVFHVTSHPFPQKEDNHNVGLRRRRVISGFSFLIAMAVAMVPGVYGIDVCRDREFKIRSQIRMTGTSIWLYWGSAFIVHMIQYTAAFAIVVAALYAFDMSTLTDAIGCLVALFVLHAPAMVLFSYCASFLFAKQETATTALPFPMATLGFLGYVLVQILNVAITDNDTPAIIVHHLLAFGVPFYGFFGGVLFIEQVGSGLNQARSYFDWDTNIPVILVAHAIQIPVFILLIIYLESKHFNQSFLQSFGVADKSVQPTLKAAHHHSHKRSDQEDDDVTRERNRALEIDVQNDTKYAVVLRSLWKMYGKSALTKRGEPAKKSPTSKLAVQDISLMFPKGEIFGLLGPNGAGKSTTLSMITGEVTPSGGDIYVNGYNMHSQTLSAIETMGSCPQTDTLWDDITMEEHMELFAILNDLPPQRSSDSIKVFSEGLHIEEHMRKKAGALSGGTKRKLTFVISMIGNPPLVLLDEPSTGMDPQSKRNLWDMIMQSFGGDRGAILTTHSMEEADALCNRIGIIVKGEFQCVGSSQHLKDKFGSGYLLEMKLNLLNNVSSNEHKEAIDRTKTEIGRILPGAQCQEEFYNRLVFAVPKERVTSLGTVFANLDRAKQTLDLEEYSFSQTTIEQVFLHFAKMQDTEDFTPVVDNSDPELQVVTVVPNV